jgi:hypothetical protein
MQRAPTSRKSGSNAPYRPTILRPIGPKLECRYLCESRFGLRYLSSLKELDVKWSAAPVGSGLSHRPNHPHALHRQAHCTPSVELLRTGANSDTKRKVNQSHLISKAWTPTIYSPLYSS